MRCYSNHEQAELNYIGRYLNKSKVKFGTINNIQTINNINTDCKLYHIKFDDGTSSKVSSHWVTILPSLLLEKNK